MFLQFKVYRHFLQISKDMLNIRLKLITENVKPDIIFKKLKTSIFIFMHI